MKDELFSLSRVIKDYKLVVPNEISLASQVIDTDYQRNISQLYQDVEALRIERDLLRKENEKVRNAPNLPVQIIDKSSDLEAKFEGLRTKVEH